MSELQKSGVFSTNSKQPLLICKDGITVEKREVDPKTGCEVSCFLNKTFNEPETELERHYQEAISEAVEAIYTALGKLATETGVLISHHVLTKDRDILAALPIGNPGDNGWSTTFTERERALRDLIAATGSNINWALNPFREAIASDSQPTTEDFKNLANQARSTTSEKFNSFMSEMKRINEIS